MSLQEFKDKLATETYGMTVQEATSKGVCLSCKRPAEKHCYSRAGLAEYRISGLCEECFDRLTMPPEEDEDV